MKVKHNRKKKIIILSIIFLMIATGCIWQSVMQRYETSKYKPVGELITVNKHKVHVYSKGSGKQAIVFIGGSGTPSSYTDFSYLQNELSSYAKTISYDHAGYGWSEQTDIPRTANTLAKELKELLQKTGFEEKCILVCHSLASLEAIRFAQLYPEQVKGIAFLDCGSPEFYLHSSEWESVLLNRVFALLRTAGANRLLGDIGAPLPMLGENLRYPKLSEDMKTIDQVMYYRYLGNRDNISAIHLINENATTVLESDRLGHIPILVLSGDYSNRWTEVQLQLSDWSENSKQITIPDSKHYIHWSNLEEVGLEITEFVLSISN